MKDKKQIKTINKRMKEILAEEQTFVLAFSAKDNESGSNTQYDALISAEMSTMNMARGIANALTAMSKNDKKLRMALMVSISAKLMGDND